MIGFRSSLLASSLLALAVSIAPAHAQQARSFVSGLGSDLNAPNCTRTAPCRTFQKAHDNTLPTGEITVLDAGSYGAVTINRNTSVINDGVGEAGALVSGDAVGITVAAGANDRVSLRGLTIKGLDPAFGNSNGIKFTSGASLTIENCAIRNMTGDGIDVIANVAANAKVSFTISNTFVSDNGGNGIFLQPSGSGNVQVVFNRVEAYNNAAHGIAVVGSSLSSIRFDVSVVDSVAAGNSLVGIIADSTNAVITMTVLRSVAANNGTGVAVAGALVAGIGISESLVAGNTKGWETINGQGVLISYGDNVWLNHDGDPNPPFTLTKK
jgi:hypothetical protein